MPWPVNRPFPLVHLIASSTLGTLSFHNTQVAAWIVRLIPSVSKLSTTTHTLLALYLLARFMAKTRSTVRTLYPVAWAVLVDNFAGTRALLFLCFSSKKAYTLQMTFLVVSVPSECRLSLSVSLPVSRQNGGSYCARTTRPLSAFPFPQIHANCLYNLLQLLLLNRIRLPNVNQL